jgi:L-alanine-DL-glutamate epimerase-like enolase superfamily enzyme
MHGGNMGMGNAFGSVAMLHVAAACQAIDSDTYSADTLGQLYHDSDLLTEPLNFSSAVASVPEGPGLRVELDEELIEKCRDASTTATQLA